MDRKSLRSSFKKIIIITFGALCYSAGIGLFLDPNKLAPGGVVGVSVIVSHVFGGQTGTWYFLINIPIVLLGWWKFGGRFILSSFYAIAWNSVFTNLFRTLPAVTGHPLTAAIAGSLLTGVGCIPGRCDHGRHGYHHQNFAKKISYDQDKYVISGDRPSGGHSLRLCFP